MISEIQGAGTSAVWGAAPEHSARAEQSQAAQQAAASDPFIAAAVEYDPRRMSMDELQAMSLELYESGAISLKDHALLSFDWERAIKDLADSAGTGLDTTIDGVGIDPDGEHDLIREWETRLAYRREQGMPVEDTERILGILRQVEAKRVLGAGIVV